jgi:hypothetical protein
MVKADYWSHPLTRRDESRSLFGCRAWTWHVRPLQPKVQSAHRRQQGSEGASCYRSVQVRPKAPGRTTRSWQSRKQSRELDSDARKKRHEQGSQGCVARARPSHDDPGRGPSPDHRSAVREPEFKGNTPAAGKPQSLHASGSRRLVASLAVAERGDEIAFLEMRTENHHADQSLLKNRRSKLTTGVDHMSVSGKKSRG